jgi:hypothetical protein
MNKQKKIEENVQHGKFQCWLVQLKKLAQC